MTHGELINAIILEASQSGLARLFKNQSGVARHKGKNGKSYTTAYGVGPDGGGGHDMIGWLVGSGKFVSIDAKVGPDKLSASQEKWMAWVIADGGIAGEARSVDEAMRLMRGEDV